MTDLNQDFAEFDAAVEADKNDTAQKALGGDKPPEQSNGFVQWVKNVPRNVTIGVIDAAINSWDAFKDMSESTFEGGAADGGLPLPEPTPAELRNAVPFDQEFRDTVLGVRGVIAEQQANGTADLITQGAAQFMIPFIGWSKALGAFKAASTVGKVAGAVGAEAVTMSTAFEPDAPRLADLVELGRQSEGKLTDALNAISPDGSAVNAYIDYMTSREDESDAESRFKNVVDGLAGSALVAGFLKGGAKSIKAGREYINSPVQLPEVSAPTHLTYAPATADEAIETTKNALLDLQGLTDVSAATPKQQAAISGLQRNIEFALENGMDVDSVIAQAQKQVADFLPKGAEIDPASKRVVQGLVDERLAAAGDAYTKAVAKRTLEEFPDDPLSALVNLSERADSALDDAERARLLGAAEIVGKQIPNKGVSVVESAEGHTLVVGKEPLITFTTPEDAAAAVADARKMFGANFETRAAAEHAAASDKNFATLHSFSRVLSTNVDRPVSTHSLLSALEKNIKGDTEQGVFYKELLGRLVRKRIGGFTTVKKKGRHENSAGFYAHADNGIEIYQKAFRDSQTLLHTFTHEAVHAATVHEINASARVLSQMERLRRNAEQAFSGTSIEADANAPKGWGSITGGTEQGRKSEYGFTNAAEFVAEIESNPEFRKLMQKTKLPDGVTAWDKYLETIAGILGISGLLVTPQGQKEFSKLMMGDTEEKPSA